MTLILAEDLREFGDGVIYDIRVKLLQEPQSIQFSLTLCIYFLIFSDPVLGIILPFAILIWCCCCKHRKAERFLTEERESGRLPSRSHTTSAESIRKPTLDLHGHTVKDAIEMTKIFLASHRCERVRIITGRGNHNPDGLAPIKSKVMKLLHNRELSYYYENDGCLVVDA
nr:uncharacterized protein LOC113813770 [Penaeus vannamei]